VDWKNRIVGHGEENPDQLLANPKNWRVHPKQQQDAITGVLDEVGWVQSVLVNRLTGNLIDGHMRVQLALRSGVEKIPVVYVELTPEEEDLILASLDPIGALAVPDAEKREELLASIQYDNASLMEFLQSMSDPGYKAGKFLDDATGAGERDSMTRDTGGYFDVCFPVTKEQRDLVLTTLRTVKDSYDMKTSTDALIWLCQYFTTGGKE